MSGDLERIVVGTVKTETKITADDILSVTCGFLPCECGGSSYWLTSFDYEPVVGYTIDPKMPTSEEFSRGNVYLLFWDEENTKDDSNPYVLTIEKLLVGLELWSKIHSRSLGDFGDIDAEDADNILQYALFGELIYG